MLVLDPRLGMSTWSRRGEAAGWWAAPRAAGCLEELRESELLDVLLWVSNPETRKTWTFYRVISL